jgi:2',3'-cyclic-nucleotide 2'-phosphodiesterase (5'-nucleotidase family)
VQAGSKGLFLGRLDLTVEGHRDPKTKKEEYFIRRYKYQLIPITKDLPEDESMVQLLQSYREKLDSNPLDEVLALVEGDPGLSNDGDNLMGQITTDAMRISTHAEAALLNNGSFTKGFKAGNLTRELLFQLYPSDSEIVVIDVPGLYLRKALEASAAKKGTDDFLQISGIAVQKDGNNLKIMVGSKPLNERRKYQVAVNDFIAGGGGGYAFFQKLKPRLKTQIMIRSLLEDSLKTKKKITPADLEKRWVLQ